MVGEEDVVCERDYTTCVVCKSREGEVYEV